MDENTDFRATLARDAMLMRDLKDSESWKCLLAQLDKMEEQAMGRILNDSESIHMVDFWRGRLAAIRELRQVPALIIQWAANLAESA